MTDAGAGSEMTAQSKAPVDRAEVRAAYLKLGLARQQLQKAFPDNGCRESPEVLAVFTAFEDAMSGLRHFLTET